MHLLLDTHVAMWSVSSMHRLPRRITELLLDPANHSFVSVVALWEIAIKAPQKRFDAPNMTASEATAEFARAGYQILDVNHRHPLMVERLPLLHGDPFDRLMVAQALTEPMRLVTHDSKLQAYSDTIIAF